MADTNLFDSITYFRNLCQKNRLCKEHGFVDGTSCGIEGLDTAMAKFRKAQNFILVDDSNDTNTFSNKVGFFDRRVNCVFVLAHYKFGDNDDRKEKLELCRRIFRQFVSRMLADKQSYRYGIAMEYLNLDNIYSKEMEVWSVNGCTGLYFMVENDEPVDLTYNADDWES